MHVETIAEFAFSRHDRSILSVLLTEIERQIGEDEAIYGNFNINDRVPLMLKSIFIPSSVGKIERYAFMDCKRIKIVYYGGTQKEWIEKKFYEQRELADAVIFFYREKQPNNKLGHYWHYDKDDNPVIWE